MKLYHSPRSRSVRPRWLLEELGVPYELIRLDFSQNQQKSTDYLKVHPHGAVPALVDGELTLFESAAICMHLADKFPDRKLAPPIGTDARALYYQWMVYSIATLEPPFLQVFLHTVRLPEEQRSAGTVSEARERFASVASVLTQALKSKPFLMGEQFSAADIMIGSTLTWAQIMGLLAGQDALQSYVARLSERPAFQKANAD
ncbi:MAG TPA: glutathione S-transferase family protein [Candidatus Acidoferrales bacterium]|nr:glutathione S-transferase family protein [Candidatus Acidoferrales bacterium]